MIKNSKKPFVSILKVTTTLFILLGALFLASCASGPKPEGEDFLSESTYGTNELKRGSAFVSPRAQQKGYLKVAVMPFRAPVELAGASIADIFTTELLKTGKYELIERSQMEQVLGEQALGLKGVTDSALAMKVGRILGVQGVIVGTVPEYGMRAVGSLELPAVGINIRMIDGETGAIVWSISDSAIAKRPISISAFARHLIESMVHRLVREWVRAGDTLSINLPPPQVISYRGKIRGAIIEVLPDSLKTYRLYRFFRSRLEKGPYTKVAAIPNNPGQKIVFSEKGLLDAKTYYYKIDAVNRKGLTGTPAGPFKVTTIGPPSPVIELHAKSHQLRKIFLTWEQVNKPEIKGYSIFRSNRKAGPFQMIKYVQDRKTNRYLDLGKASARSTSGGAGYLKDKTRYFYKIHAINVVDVKSPDSPIVSAITKGPPPPVTELQAQNDGLRKVPVTWVPINKPEVKGYSIFRAGQRSGPFEMIKFVKGKDTNQYLDKGKSSSWGGAPGGAGYLKDSMEYFYKVQTVNVVDVKGPDSPVISAVTKGPPSPVPELQAESKQARKVPLTWMPVNETEVKGYSIFRAGQRSGPFEMIKFVKGKDENQYLDKGKGSSWGNEGHLDNYTKYYYKIQTVNVVDVHSLDSPVISAITKPVPVAVAGLKASQLEVKQVSLSWQPNPEIDIKEYNVFRGESPKDIKKHIKTLPGTVFAYTDKALKDGRKYFYKVHAVDKDKLVGEFSSVVCSMTKPLPVKPKGLAIKFEAGQVKLSWQKNPEDDIVTYRIFKKAFFSWNKIGETVEPVFFYSEGIKGGKKIILRVKAVNNLNLESEPSEETSITVPKSK